MPDTWLQLAVRGDPERLDAVANFLIERGSPGIEIKRSEVRGYFPAPFDVASIRRDVQKFLSAAEEFCRSGAKPDLTWRIVKDADWNKRWRKFMWDPLESTCRHASLSIL